VNLYIFDSSSFITPYRFYYATDIAPSFWDQLERLIADGTVCTIDKVKEEITRIDDELSRWFRGNFPRSVRYTRKTNTDNLFLFGDDELDAYHEVIKWAESSGYKRVAIETFKDSSKADAFLIAFCKAHDLTLVTEEVFSSKKNRIPIPNACNFLGVKYLRLFDFMRQVNISL